MTAYSMLSGELSKCNHRVCVKQVYQSLILHADKSSISNHRGINYIHGNHGNQAMVTIALIWQLHNYINLRIVCLMRLVAETVSFPNRKLMCMKLP